MLSLPMKVVLYVCLGYLSGNIMYAYWVPKLLKGVDVRDYGADHNPGAANATLACGLPMGILCAGYIEGYGTGYAGAPCKRHYGLGAGADRASACRGARLAAVDSRQGRQGHCNLLWCVYWIDAGDFVGGSVGGAFADLSAVYQGTSGADFDYIGVACYVDVCDLSYAVGACHELRGIGHFDV